ncbi:MAG: hypothetical protein KJ607_08090 [Bacteroidetes bacterium]|nr:hypothetical protein [Bacteroidota bacterium]
MRSHNGMRPQDIVVLLKIISYKESEWNVRAISNDLFLSPAEITHSLNRCVLAKLLDTNKKEVYRNNLYDFLTNGIMYVFPVRPGAIVRGIVTGSSAVNIAEKLVSEDIYVWPYDDGNIRGQEIRPLYKNIPQAAERDSNLYELLCLIDMLRIGKIREVKVAKEKLYKLIFDEK